MPKSFTQSTTLARTLFFGRSGQIFLHWSAATLKGLGEFQNKKSRPLFIIIFKLKNNNFKTQDFSPLIERVLAGVQLLLQNFTGEEKPFFVDLFATQLSRCMPAQVGALQQQTFIRFFYKCSKSCKSPCHV